MNNLTEKEIVKIWKDQLLDRERLSTEDGKPLKVIYPGRPNDDRGADFQDAVIITGRVLQRGDIEIHLRSSGWREHGHHRDMAYNRVILHVVLRRNTKTAARLENGQLVPVLVLDKYVKIPERRETDSNSLVTSPILPCRSVCHPGTNHAIQSLDKAGEARFLMKAEVFRKGSDRVGAGQALYQGIMVALGYSKNKLPFLELSHRLPLRILEVGDQLTDTEWILSRQAMLLGASGLLSPDYLGQHYSGNSGRLLPSMANLKPLAPTDWHLLRVRPNNSPILRLIAMSCLLLRYRGRGLLEGLVELLKKVPIEAPERLGDGLIVASDDVTSGCSPTAEGKNRPTPLGRGRADEIIVNVLLPFGFAWSQSAYQPGLAGHAFALYRLYPRLVTNSIEKHMMGQLGLDATQVNSALRQQGLIHTYKNLCSVGRCDRCELSQLQSRHDIQV